MTFRSWRLFAAACVPALIVACGGSTTINFVGDPDNTGGEENDGSGGTDDGSGGTDVGGLGGMGGNVGPGSGGGPVIASYCGDGSIDPESEACDDGNERSRDGCDSACEVEPPFSCSGEPSACTTAGNGTLDVGEECEDGNTEDGDGCSFDGSVEGKCEEPVVLTLGDEPDGSRMGVVTSATSSGGMSVPAQACAGLNLGSGADRVFEFEVPLEMNVHIAVAADFDAIVRLYEGTACAPGSEVGCIDAVGADDTERFDGAPMPAGTYFIAVDGADEGEEGGFTLSVRLDCAVEEVAEAIKIERVSLFQKQATLKNTHPTCAFDLSRAGLVQADDGDWVASTLPEEMIAPGTVRRFAGIVNANNPGATPLDGAAPFFDLNAASVYLCLGPCDPANGSNVLDVFHSGTVGHTLPASVTFSPDRLTSLTSASSTDAYLRVAYDGVAPDFLASDYVPAYVFDGDDFQLLGNGAAYGATASYAFVADTEEGTVFHPVTAASNNYSGYGLPMPTHATLPTYISMKVKGVGADNYKCYAEFGQPTASLGATWVTDHHAFDYQVFQANFLTFHEYVYGTAAEVENQWLRVEYRNIDWTAFTFDIFVDGVELAAAVPMSSNLASLTNIYLMPWTLGDLCYYSDIIVYAGPPLP